MSKLVTVVAMLMFAAQASSCPIHYVTVLEDGSVTIEGARYSSEEELRAALRSLQCGRSPPELILKLDQHATYDKVAKALVMLQRTGSVKIGFINTQEERPK